MEANYTQRLYSSQLVDQKTLNGDEVRHITSLAYIDLIKKYEVQLDNSIWDKLSPMQIQIAHRCRYVLHNLWWILFLDIFLLIFLFGKQISLACCGPSIEIFVDVMLILSAFVFSIEIVLLLFARLKYFLSALFFVDIVCLVLIALELSFVREVVFQQDGTVTRKYATAIYSIVDVLKLVLIVKLIRIFYWRVYKSRTSYLQNHLGVPLQHLDILISKKHGRPLHGKTLFPSEVSPGSPFYSHNKSLKEVQPFEGELELLNRSNLPRFSRSVGPDHSSSRQQVEQNPEPLLAVKLMNFTNNNLMFLLLFMLLIMPIFDREFWMETPPSYQLDPIFANALAQAMGTNTTDTYIQALKSFYSANRIALLSLEIPSIINYVLTTDLSYLRNEEIRSWKESVVSKDGAIIQASVAISVRYMIIVQSILYLVQTLLIVLFFIACMLLLDRDAQKRVVVPIQNMIRNIRKMAGDPATAFGSATVAPQNSDLVLIEETIEKISFMLLLGFGEAGSRLFSKVLLRGELSDSIFHETEAEYCIFGFCDIRNFTDITDVLKQDVLDFVNRIADIVHGEVSQHEGFPNKNIGDAFLVVWKLQKPAGQSESTPAGLKTIQDFEDGKGSYRTVPSMALTVFGEKEEMNSRTAELALLAFIKIINRIKTDSHISSYNLQPGLKAAIPNFEVKLGCGLHAGWAIEGPIGSFMKIDLSYFSENVDMAAHLEGLTKHYHAGLLFTESIYGLIRNPLLSTLCRRIDRIRLPSSKIHDIYTIDIEGASVETTKPNMPIYSQPKQKNYISPSKAAIAPEDGLACCPQFIPYSAIDAFIEYAQTDSTLQSIFPLIGGLNNQSKRTKFLALHNDAINLYINGDWTESKTAMDKLVAIFGPDEVIGAIKEYMAKYDFKAPPQWDGARVL